LSTPYNFGQSSQNIQRGVWRTLPGSQLIERNDARGGFGYFESSQCGATEEWRAIPVPRMSRWVKGDLHEAGKYSESQKHFGKVCLEL
jgi:hypothetical protein